MLVQLLVVLVTAVHVALPACTNCNCAQASCSLYAFLSMLCDAVYVLLFNSYNVAVVTAIRTCHSVRHRLSEPLLIYSVLIRWPLKLPL